MASCMRPRLRRTSTSVSTGIDVIRLRTMSNVGGYAVHALIVRAAFQFGPNDSGQPYGSYVSGQNQIVAEFQKQTRAQS